jgi:tetratricopeptide (TPR) repeat protein
VTALSENSPPTTSGGIAVTNMDAQIEGLMARLPDARPPRTGRAVLTAVRTVPLIDLLLQRGQVLGRIGDYERAADLAESLVLDAPDDGEAWLARVRVLSTFHRFPLALVSLDAARQHGADPSALDAERATLLQATGCYAEATALRRTAAERRPDVTTLGALAVLQGEQGLLIEAERLFTEAGRRYRSVSPFPIADLDFRRGLMWRRRSRLRAARAFFDAAARRLPAHAPAQGKLAEIDAALGHHESAIERLRPLTTTSDDPFYPAALAGVLRSADQLPEAEHWRAAAAARYRELVTRHPEAYAHHAADFWLGVGDDRSEGLRLREMDRAHRAPVVTTSARPVLFGRSVPSRGSAA